VHYESLEEAQEALLSEKEVEYYRHRELLLKQR
jgi:hypothetical protein